MTSHEYRAELLDRVIPFWEEHSIDREKGGYFTCLDRDGTVFDTDKFVWLQARQVWMFSHLYRTVERRPSWLQVAEHGANFLEKHGRSESGDWYFSLLRDGTPQVAPYNIFSDCFGVMAFAEYAAAADSDGAAEIARSTYRRVQERKADPKGPWNKLVPGGRALSAMAFPMIQLNMAQVLSETIGHEGLDLGPGGIRGVMEANVETILARHVDREAKAVFERVLPDGSHPESMDGRLLNPGHAAEVLWMVMEVAEKLDRRDWLEQATEALLWTFERGWDEKAGGIFYYQDYRGFPPEKLEYDMKLWWVHLESMYAALVAATSEAGGASGGASGGRPGRAATFHDWFDRIESYSWDQFRDPEHGEWYGYLHRDGSPSTRQKGGKWKGCFHLPRILLKVQRRLDIAEARKEAARFVTEEEQFHLGHLVTEQSHPVTRDLSSVIAQDPSAGVAELLQVDEDLISVAREKVGDGSWTELRDAIVQAGRQGRKIRFSGCGSTGRLAAILERMWRRTWLTLRDSSDDPAEKELLENMADLAAGIITGGDRALVKSVESFEDYQAFGRRQIRDLGIGKDDLCVAISEGGETSSVIGTAWEAIEVGAGVFFVYNNPTELLLERTIRSRELINHQGVVAMDLTTGPMAIAGSTRMQATTMELLAVGSALDSAAAILAGELLSTPETKKAVPEQLRPAEYLAAFESVLSQLGKEENLALLARFAELEEEVYDAGGLVTYVADRYLLDVFSDTSERTPTFNLPPMRSVEETDAPPSWAFPKHAHLETEAAWEEMLLHAPRGLEWDSETYRSLDAPQRMIDAPPPLASRFLADYAIGCEGLEKRSGPSSVFLGVSVGAEDRDRVAEALHREAKTMPRQAHCTIGAPSSAKTGTEESAESLTLSISWPDTVTELFEHLAIKLVLNTVSTATMARMGRIRGNYMIQVDPTNKKLVDRGSRIIAGLTGISYERACRELHETWTQSEAELAGRSRVAATLDRLATFLVEGGEGSGE